MQNTRKRPRRRTPARASVDSAARAERGHLERRLREQKKIARLSRELRRAVTKSDLALLDVARFLRDRLAVRGRPLLPTTDDRQEAIDRTREMVHDAGQPPASVPRGSVGRLSELETEARRAETS